jgi:hypothetical protein
MCLSGYSSSAAGACLLVKLSTARRARHAQVREALSSKISRERVGTELEGMFNGACVPRFCMEHAHSAPEPPPPRCCPAPRLPCASSSRCRSAVYALPRPPPFAGPAPVESVRLLQRLGLFSSVFSVPPPLSPALADAVGPRSTSLMAAADSLASSLSLQVAMHLSISLATQ